MKNYPKMQISNRVKGIPEALSIYINQLVYDQKRRGIDITTLSLGEAYFDIPCYDFSKLNFEKGYHYSESIGLLELRQKICEYYKKSYNANVKYQNEILISSGSKPIIFMAMQAVLNEGDEVLIHEPAWLSYQEQIKLVGAIPRFIPYNCTAQDFNKYFTEKTRMIVINNPNNPAGWIYKKEELQSVYNQCRPKGIYLLVDEAYSDFVVNDDFYSAVNISENKDGVIVVNSLSKNMGISGWRVGYVIAASEIIKYILKLNQHLITCASTILLHYLAYYFDDLLACTLPQVRETVKKRQRIESYMKEIGLQFLPGSSTFYFFIDISKFQGTSLDFALYMLLKYNLAVVPGSAYGSSTEKFIRISIGTESEERISKALDLIKRLLDSKEFDKEYIHSKLKENNWTYFKK
jgi:aspartate/methionine/tyrosine aminotransferase